MYRLIATRVMDRPGVLNRITQITLRPHYNIETLSLLPTDDSNIKMIIIGVDFPNEEASQQLCKQLEKQVEVLNAVDITTLTDFN